LNDLENLRCIAKRLERYAARVREKIWLGNRNDLYNALADVAELAEISRRFYLAIQQHISTSAPHTHPLKDDPS
jgi:hypothetical protein